jgi:hypothetical protein
METDVELQILATIAIAIFGACIAWGQWVTARSKLILDLYEHRRKVYSDFHGPIGEAMREGRSDLNNYVDYIRVLDQARFLFGRDVLDYIEDMRETLNNLGEVTSMLGGGNDMRMPEDERLKYANRRSELMRQIADFWPRLDELMIPYMLMEQKRPWSISRVTGYVSHKIRVASKAHMKWRSRGS